jgi:hypothetical protein
MLDYDLAASSFPPTLRATTPYRMAQVEPTAESSSDTVARHTLLLTLMALERYDPITVRAVLGAVLTDMPTADVLAALETMATGPSSHRLTVTQ